MDRKPRPAKMLRADYNARLIEWAAAAAEAAKASAEECSLLYNYAIVKENMNRRYRFPDRTHKFIPYAKALAGLSDDFVDHELGLVAFRRQGHANKYKAVVTNYAAHPLCVGNSAYLVSADYQGYLRRTVEETLGGALCLTLTGAAGDHHPLYPESGFAQAEVMGRALGTQAICRLFDAVGADEDTRLRTAYEPIRLLAREGPPFETSFSLLGIGPILLAGMPGELVGCLGAQGKRGGKGGGGAKLTEAGDQAISLFWKLYADFQSFLVKEEKALSLSKIKTEKKA